MTWVLVMSCHVPSLTKKTLTKPQLYLSSAKDQNSAEGQSGTLCQYVHFPSAHCSDNQPGLGIKHGENSKNFDWSVDARQVLSSFVESIHGQDCIFQL